MADLLASFRSEAPADEKPGAARKRLLRVAGEKAPGLKHLVEASAPVGADGEHLPHAASWLRYVLLLSYKGQRTVVAAPNAANGMAEAWKAFGTGLGLDFPVEAKLWAKHEERQAPAIRWNQQPHAGQASAVVADLTLACLGHLRFDGFVEARQKDLFAALRSTDTTKKYYDKGF